jgi:LPXTG-motif cell wall-anchored protein
VRRSGRKSGSRLTVVAVAAAAIMMLAAGPALAASVGVQDFSYSPQTVTIKAGESVTWTSSGPSPHTVTADDGSFDSGTLNPGDSFSHTFATAGTFQYHCQFHVAQGMVGTVVVQAAATTPPPSTTPPGGTTPPPTGGEPSSTATPLPNTGLGTGWLIAGIAGFALVIAGAVVLFGARRRAA